jgi:hypothetical protein
MPAVTAGAVVAGVLAVAGAVFWPAANAVLESINKSVDAIFKVDFISASRNVWQCEQVAPCHNAALTVSVDL